MARLYRQPDEGLIAITIVEKPVPDVIKPRDRQLKETDIWNLSMYRISYREKLLMRW